MVHYYKTLSSYLSVHERPQGEDVSRTYIHFIFIGKDNPFLDGMGSPGGRGYRAPYGAKNED